ncbi:MAG: nuclear transport factor 2 family protein [Alphaproteobacteria bacterium]|nr:nuclear transport factor 2 family protein [Alphaproteobacteria bacterium]
MSDKDAIRNVAEKYAEGTRNRDIALLKTLFHENAVMSGWLGPDLLIGSPAPFFGALEANEVGLDYSSETIDVWSDGMIGGATTKEENLLGLSFTNVFQMVKTTDGDWKIVSKLFRHR